DERRRQLRRLRGRDTRATLSGRQCRAWRRRRQIRRHERDLADRQLQQILHQRHEADIAAALRPVDTAPLTGTTAAAPGAALAAGFARTTVERDAAGRTGRWRRRWRWRR